ncbi:MAG: type B 50S ribosomal protein L31 [Bdellovibrionales bacterium]|nr:type B 50S ribosomal protein L31 [Bdellovibrionales bacterium]
MKKSIHPDNRFVVFKDVSCDFSYLTKSTVKTTDTIKWEDGKEYPLVKIEVSSQSHPFYTGQNRLLDTEGRAERFRKKYGSRSKAVKKPSSN